MSHFSVMHKSSWVTDRTRASESRKKDRSIHNEHNAAVGEIEIPVWSTQCQQ